MEKYKLHHQERIDNNLLGRDVSTLILKYWDLIDWETFYNHSLIDTEYMSTGHVWSYTFWNCILRNGETKHDRSYNHYNIPHYGNGYIAVLTRDNDYLFIEYDIGSCSGCDDCPYRDKGALEAYFEKHISDCEILTKEGLDKKMENFYFKCDD